MAGSEIARLPLPLSAGSSGKDEDGERGAGPGQEAEGLSVPESLADGSEWGGPGPLISLRDVSTCARFAGPHGYPALWIRLGGRLAAPPPSGMPRTMASRPMQG
jgi:hypothetical protein